MTNLRFTEGSNAPAKRDYVKITEQHVDDVSRWKRHYGLRAIGTTEDGKTVINGLDVYKVTSACGQDLELLLMFLDQRGCVVDWLGYAKTATIESWLMETILRKISYPITEVWGERHWLQVRARLGLWFIEYMDDLESNK
jgi:hypothetical protein